MKKYILKKESITFMMTSYFCNSQQYNSLQQCVCVCVCVCFSIRNERQTRSSKYFEKL